MTTGALSSSYLPNAWQRVILQLTHAAPENWFGRRMAYALRNLMSARLGNRALDVSVFGLTLRLHGYENVAEKRLMYMPQYFDREERLLLRQYFPANGTFVDIGANVGGYALFMASIAGPEAHIYAVEPQPALCERLRFNAARNHLHQIQVESCALGSRDEQTTLYTYRHNQGEASLHPGVDAHQPDASLSVSCQTLLHLLQGRGITRVDAMKIDTEGSEEDILLPFFQEAPPELWPHMMVLEYVPSRWGGDLDGALAARGYRMIKRTRLNAVYLRDAA